MKQLNKINFRLPTQGERIKSPNGRIYRVDGIINEGGFAWVYRGFDEHRLLPVVFKIFKPENRPFDDVMKQWSKETGLFQKLRHQNIVVIYDSFVYENLFYIILEKAWGTIEEYVKSKSLKKLTENETKKAAFHILAGLDFIHKNHIIHKDITIKNILVFNYTSIPILSIFSFPTFKISDFGISKECLEPFKDMISKTQAIHPQFKPPEFVKFNYTTEQSDLYQLGLVLLYCLTGKLPFQENMDQNQVNQVIMDGIPKQMAESIKTAFGDFVSVMLRRRAEYRFNKAIDAWNNLIKIK